MEVAATTPWWDIFGTLATAAATVALAGFAAVELLALRRNRLAAERLASARIASTGFLVRRQLRSWLGSGEGSPDELEGWLVDAKNAGMFGEHIDRAEARFVEMLQVAGTAAETLRRDVDEASALFFNGTEWLNRFAASPRPRGIEIADWVNLRDMAWRDLSECVVVIDQRLASEGLLRVARLKAAKTRAEFPSMDAYLARHAAMLDQIVRQKKD